MPRKKRQRPRTAVRTDLRIAAITLELDKPLSPDEASGILAKAAGVKLVDDAAANHFPMPLEASLLDAIDPARFAVRARRGADRASQI